MNPRSFPDLVIRSGQRIGLSLIHSSPCVFPDFPVISAPAVNSRFFYVRDGCFFFQRETCVSNEKMGSEGMEGDLYRFTRAKYLYRGWSEGNERISFNVICDK
jgi:hypothetical protein